MPHRGESSLPQPAHCTLLIQWVLWALAEVLFIRVKTSKGPKDSFNVLVSNG